MIARNCRSILNPHRGACPAPLLRHLALERPKAVHLAHISIPGTAKDKSIERPAEIGAPLKDNPKEPQDQDTISSFPDRARAPLSHAELASAPSLLPLSPACALAFLLAAHVFPLFPLSHSLALPQFPANL